MGKKSKRSKQQADPSARKAKTFFSIMVRKMEDLYQNKDYAEIVKIANSPEHQQNLLMINNAGASCQITYSNAAYFVRIAIAYHRTGDNTNAITYFQGAMEIISNSTFSSNRDITKLKIECDAYLVDCFVAGGRCTEACDIVYSQIQPNMIHNAPKLEQLLKFFQCMLQRGDWLPALALAEQYLVEYRALVAAEGSKMKFGKNYVEFNLLKIIGRCYQDTMNYHKAIKAFEQIFDLCPFEMSMNWKAADVYSNVGRCYAALGHYERAIHCVDQVQKVDERLAVEQTVEKDISTLFIEFNRNIADIHSYIHGNEEKALKLYLDTIGKMDKCYTPNEKADDHAAHNRGEIYQRRGIIYLRLKRFGDAKKDLELSIKLLAQSQETRFYRDSELRISYQELGRVYLEEYMHCAEGGIPLPGKRKALEKALENSKKASDLIVDTPSEDRSVYLDLAHEHFLLGNTPESFEMLKDYLDFAIASGSLYCQGCHQKCCDGDTMQVCSGCKVASYCSCVHQTQAWSKYRTGHKKLCNLFSFWRRIKKGKSINTSESCDQLFEKYMKSTFRQTLRSKRNAVKTKKERGLEEEKAASSPNQKTEDKAAIPPAQKVEEKAVSLPSSKSNWDTVETEEEKDCRDEKTTPRTPRRSKRDKFKPKTEKDCEDEKAAFESLASPLIKNLSISSATKGASPNDQKDSRIWGWFGY